MIPKHLTGSEFEKLIVEQCKIYEDQRIACIGRYGVQSTMAPSKIDPGKFEPLQIQSLPDFEGSYEDGTHIIFDAKVCSQASFPWAKYRSITRGARVRQLKHMLKRSRFGARCFFLFHWNERQLKSRVVPAMTCILPVRHDDDYWMRVETAEVKSLTLEDCFDMGCEVAWETTDRGTKYRPNFLLSRSNAVFSKKLFQTEDDSGLVLKGN